MRSTLTASGTVGRLALAALLTCVALAGLVLPQPAAAGPATLRLGFADSEFLRAGGPPLMGLAQGLGATLVRLDADWSAIARRRPSDGSDPNDPAYDWSSVDAGVLAAVTHGLEPLVLVATAPLWAQGAGRPRADAGGPDRAIGGGAWKPDPVAFGQFATALARRYDGGFVPAAGQPPLPRVRRYQAWNEPNLNQYLAPQWERSGSGFRAFSTERYRALLNAFADAVKAVHLSNMVITAGSAPFGDPPGGTRMRPLAFWRDVLCVTHDCPLHPRFSAISNHPYGDPLQIPYSRDDLTVRATPRLVSLLRRAERLHRTRGPLPHHVWATELGYESNPPDPDGATTAVQAYYMQEAIYRLWRAGVDTLTWFLVADQPKGPAFDATVQTGVFFADRTPKPAARAFAFPFVTDPDDPRSFWGMAPHSGKVAIERRVGTRWVTVARAATRGRMFSGRGHWGFGATLRAVQGRLQSLAWQVR